ncbi:uncharacterized protein LOC117958245 isoform X2 [Etheostoma cragini]|uniref:uncharacterized protein LOC117958245 isoform X2 n=1 Tax=Etheostoma cragini TaxID=417921 RepID=UPI00155DECD1|nr:uncharacterized protein LOC117958245 isoform X2 [Etheostoma cragini]
MMETKDPRASPEGPIPQDDGGLWMKINSNIPVTDHIHEPSGQSPGDETTFAPSAPAVITRYVGVMDDEGADNVFIPLPPSYMDLLLPGKGSTDATSSYSGLTLTNGAADATEAEANPSGLDWPPGEKQIMAEQSELDKGIANTPQASEESKNIIPSDQNQRSMEEICYLSGRQHKENTTGGEESKLEQEDIAIFSERQEKWREEEKDKYPKQVPSSSDEKSENDTCFEKKGTQSKEMCGTFDSDSKPTTENVHCDDEESDEDFEPYGPPELSQCNHNTTDAATDPPQVPETPTQVSSGDKAHVDNISWNYTVTKTEWVRRESDTSETQVSQLSVSGGNEEMPTMEEQEDGSRRITTDIQQGEQLLERLQRLQLQQEGCSPESPQDSQKVVQETRRGETNGAFGTKVDDLTAREANLTCGDKTEETAKTNLMEKRDVEARMPSSTTPVDWELQAIARDSHWNPLIKTPAYGSQVPSDLSLTNTQEKSPGQVPFPSPFQQLSVAEMSIQEEAQGRQILQRAVGVLNQADNPDVLEIPFKTNVSLEPLPTKDGPSGNWQFSEQKMKKEISQEIQRELVMVNQGKIPGGYSKGEVRQLKETKLLFEAFQQDNTEGPQRQRKPRTSLKKGRVYPSVLERTRSLEMLSLKSCSLSRAHSLRQCKETEKTPEILRSISPIGSSRDKTSFPAYTKGPVYRSMDSIKTDVSAVDMGRRSRDGHATQDSPVLQQNPFVKLRPALALKPEVEKDIREAKEREEELRRQRCDLYGENTQRGEDGETSRFKGMFPSGVSKQSSGKLERVWPPPPSMKDQMKSEQTQESKAHRAGGQKSPLWQRWESGLINGEGKEKK